jgi:hypothetical protein
MRIGRFEILKRQMKLDDEAAEKLKESFETIAAILDSNGIAHKQLKMEIDEEKVAGVIAEAINGAMGEATPENVVDIARGIAAQLAEMFMSAEVDVTEEEQMAMSETPVSEDDMKALAEFREKQYQQQEKLHVLLDRLIGETVDDAETIEILSDSYKAIKEELGVVSNLASAVKALADDIKGVKRQLAMRPRASISADTLARPDEVSEEVKKEMENTDKVFDEYLGLWLKKE